MAVRINPAVRKFSITFDDIAEGRVRLFENGACTNNVNFFTYGQALMHIDQLRDKGWLPLTPNVEAIEALLRTAEKYHQKVSHRDDN